MITSDNAVTSLRSLAAVQPSSCTSAEAAAEFVSKTELIVKPQSLRRRAMFAPMRPTPTNPILSDIGFYFAPVLRSRKGQSGKINGAKILTRERLQPGHSLIRQK